MTHSIDDTLAWLKTPEGIAAAQAVSEVDRRIRAGFEKVISDHWDEYRSALRKGLGGDQDPMPQQMLTYLYAAFVLATRPAIEEHVRSCCLAHILNVQIDAIELGSVLAMQKQQLQEVERIAAEKETKH